MPERFERPPPGVLRPNLFIIGAPKSGTTSLHAYLSEHPDVFMSNPKEPGFFVPEMTYYPKELDWYLGLFRDAADARCIGESSTHYAKRPLYQGVPERIARFAPDARLIYLMRDPIERAVSHYWHNARMFEEARPVLDAIRDVPYYRAFGDYRYQLEPYYETFGRDRVLVLTFEELVADPAATVARVVAWLGLEPFRALPDFSKENARPERLVMSRGGVLAWIRATALWRRASPHVPARVRRMGSRMAEEEVTPSEVPTTEVVEFLSPWAKERIEALSELLGRSFPEWPSYDMG